MTQINTEEQLGGAHQDIIDQNFAARITREEIRVIFEGERRAHPNLERLVWQDAIRQAKLQLVMEGESE